MIWEPIIRICHWVLVIAFFLNYFILEPGSNQHQIIGYIALCTVIIRLGWGVLSSGYSSFKNVNLHIDSFKLHFIHLKQRKIPAKNGHNPIGWLMIFVTWLLFIGLAITGFMHEEIDRFFGNSLIISIHSAFSNILFATVIVHIVAVVMVGWWGNIRLIQPMITGKRKI